LRFEAGQRLFAEDRDTPPKKPTPFRRATNEFEGVETLCLYNLLAHGDPFAQIPAFEPLLEGVEGVLDRG
jgi:hypothetical protein